MVEKTDNSVIIIKTGSDGGYTVIDKNSQLRRLNYFDGKFLRAPDLILEQQALLNQIRLSNLATGSGVVFGFDITQGSGDSLDIGGGLAFDGSGRVLQLAQGISVGMAELIEKSAGNNSTASAQSTTQGKATFDDCEIADSSTADTTLDSGDLYLITICHAEAMCGEEDVFGKLCESACVTSTDRPYILEGVSIHAWPLELTTALKTSSSVSLSGKHLRSRVASAFFQQERQNPASHISKEGLNSNIWCLGAEAIPGDCVPIAVVSRNTTTLQFLDAWTVRRERMESPPRHYWASIMAMRPWKVFLAQVLQFQCQLSKCIGGGDIIDDGPCADERELLRKAAADLKELMQLYQATAEKFAQLSEESFTNAVAGESQSFAMTDIQHTYDQLVSVDSLQLPSRLLINQCGIVELPSAGYLPVNASDSMTINEQVRAMMGEGVDLRFCVVRPDYIPHALEEAQHMERICLLKGLDDPANKPRVDVLVPDGRIEAFEPEVEGTGYEMEVHAGGDELLSDVTKTVGLGGLYQKAEGVQSVLYKSAANQQNSAFQFSPKNLIAARVLQASDSLTDEQEAQQETQISGAARGEALETGGYAFYFAGRMPMLMQQFVATLAKDQVLQQAGSVILAQAKASDSLSSSTSGQEGSPETAEEAAANKKQNNKMAEAIEVEATRLSSGLRNNNSDDVSEPIYDLWLSMRSDQDPFELPHNGFTNISAELVIMVSMVAYGVPIHLTLEITQNGTLTVDDILATGTLPRRRCTMNTNGMINSRYDLGGEVDTQTVAFKIAEQLYISFEGEGGARPSFKLDLPELSAFDAWDTDSLDIDIGFQFTRSWDSAEQAQLQGLVTYLLRYATGNQTYDVSGSMPLFSGSQRINADVLKPDNLYHDTSLTALREIGNGLGDSQFADIRALQLFPPPQDIPAELLIYGNRDWVLFHRRREISCGYDEAPQLAVKPLRYRLYYINTLSSKEEFELLRQGLLENDGALISRFQPISSTIVEYEAGLHVVSSSHNNLQNDWQALVNDLDASLILGAIGSQGAAYDEGESMAQLRLESLTDVLAPVTPVNEDGELFTLPQVPDVLAEGSVDGVIVLASAQQAAVDTVCHQVYRLDMQLAEIDNFSKALNAAYNQTLERYQAQQLDYNPLFADSTADFSDSDVESALQTAWQAVGNSQPQYLFAATRVDENGNVIDDQPYVEQGQRIVTTLQGSADLGHEFVQTTDDIGACPGVSILVTTPQVQLGLINVYAVKTESSVPQDTNKQIIDEVQEAGYWEWLNSGQMQAISMGIVGYDENGVANSTNINNIINKAAADGLFGAGIDTELFVNAISKNESTDEDRERNKLQAEQIRLALSAEYELLELKNTSVTWNDDGTSSVLLVAIQPISAFGEVIMVGNASDWSIENPEDLVTDFSESVSVDESGDVVKDAAYEAAVNAMLEKGETIKNIEIVGLNEAEAEAQRVKTEALLAELKVAGVAMQETKIVFRSATDAERINIEKLGAGSKAGVIMTR